jgi:nitroimidazol reductase NimA-like FMN-containing flavoprotein (pyridoxamine 5'-phosphate oxidase superfamily)
MRLKNKERGTEFAMEVFRDCDYATIAVLNPDGTPYCVPVSPVVVDGALYFHSAKVGQKADDTAYDPHICITGVRSQSPVPEKYSISYESAVASGKCSVVSDDVTKMKVLWAIVEKYAKSNDGTEVFNEHIDEEFSYVCVFRVDIEQITGKESRFDHQL